MPTANIFLYGNLPVELEMDSTWEYAYNASVRTNKKVVFLDMTQHELENLVSDNYVSIMEQRDAYQVDRAMRDEIRDHQREESRAWRYV